VKGQGKLNMIIIFESVLMLFTQNYQKLQLAKVGAFFET